MFIADRRERSSPGELESPVRCGPAVPPRDGPRWVYMHGASCTGCRNFAHVQPLCCLLLLLLHAALLCWVVASAKVGMSLPGGRCLFPDFGDGGVTGFRWYFLAQLRGAGERAAVAAGPSGLLHGIRFRCGGLKQKQKPGSTPGRPHASSISK